MMHRLLTCVAVGLMIIPAAPMARMTKGVQAVRTAGTTVDVSRLKAVPQRLNELVAQGQLAGVVVLISHYGRVVAHDAVGFRDREARDATRPDTIFRVASITTAMTAMGIIMLQVEK